MQVDRGTSLTGLSDDDVALGHAAADDGPSSAAIRATPLGVILPVAPVGPSSTALYTKNPQGLLHTRPPRQLGHSTTEAAEAQATPLPSVAVAGPSARLQADRAA
ncbi:hypothetical protein FOZ61_002002 [Perkinsus olseni]|uniref:Uncharacterized protein n=1 Tax=Perkinsus olseni TaxID=32597 RepID=A0A7J6KPB1_PEROL|nr:hypothetical protein FOZ61_002002 [Perkinsus olseni]